MEVVVIPTSGNIRDKDGRLQPGVNCVKRLEAALNQGPTGPEVVLIFAGGVRDNPSNSEAEIAISYFRKHYPDAQYADVLSSAGAKYTAADMRILSWDLYLYIAEHESYEEKDENDDELPIDRIWIVTHPDHATLAARTLKHLGWNCIHLLDSGEPPPYRPWELMILKIVYYLDPTWQTILSLPLRRLANRRGRNE